MNARVVATKRALIGAVVLLSLGGCPADDLLPSTGEDGAGTPSLTFSAEPASVSPGGEIVLTWSTTDAVSCIASGGWAGTKAPSGSETIAPFTGVNAYTLTCIGSDGGEGESVTVTVTTVELPPDEPPPDDPSPDDPPPDDPPDSGSGTYSTDFNTTENPISEDGAWQRADNEWTNVATANGVAFGTNGPKDTYDDSYALLSGFDADQQSEAVVYRSSSLNEDATHEVELLLRFGDDADGVWGYECLFSFYGGVSIVRWNGDLGDFTVLPTTGPGKFGRELVSGDVVSAKIVGNVISTYVNGSLRAQATDSTFDSGQPGIGFFTRPDGNSAHFALTSFKASSVSK